ncbi:adenylate cyclase [Aureimonas sp. SA4125]|uniref:adenylate/guanylate cyclase domain-containing protein n=1 Tax=Aureimonas sp. SA4125 TaxID=2826993 RepID=UPI001CC563FA|nr:adenylate/guanylate cyclase domain-containing protein [Aureimonas sp. SA4125]BDA82558.1 adenylate cyclase [Aureimonas sp. SA4125]
MSEDTLVERIGDWLIEQALADSPFPGTFRQFCLRLRSIGIPVVRARVIWPTLHPLFRAETLLWHLDEPLEFQQFNHQDRESEAWKQSPIRWMLEEDVTVMRRRLTGPDPQLDFALLEELAGEGYTDFLGIRTSFTGSRPALRPDGRADFGLHVTWVTERRSGFSDADIGALQRLQPYFAVACKTAIQPRMTANITDAYLGPTVARQVLSGQIQLGSGSHTLALVWYSDLRDSTRFSETLDETRYLALLNAYFGCVATAAIEAGGEVLAFIGDAVLAIFPIKGEGCEVGETLDDVVRAATEAAHQARAAVAALNATRQADGERPIGFGIAMNIGEVMFGNVGIPRRLSFSIVGPTVNEAARIEKMTKTLGTGVLATHAVAATDPSAWTSVGAHLLAGLEHPVELYALLEAAAVDPLRLAAPAAEGFR